jgi:hypothetical protein
MHISSTPQSVPRYMGPRGPFGHAVSFWGSKRQNMSKESVSVSKESVSATETKKKINRDPDLKKEDVPLWFSAPLCHTKIYPKGRRRKIHGYHRLSSTWRVHAPSSFHCNFFLQSKTRRCVRHESPKYVAPVFSVAAPCGSYPSVCRRKKRGLSQTFMLARACSYNLLLYYCCNVLFCYNWWSRRTRRMAAAVPARRRAIITALCLRRRPGRPLRAAPSWLQPAVIMCLQFIFFPRDANTEALCPA